jgi:hypothetical protein
MLLQKLACAREQDCWAPVNKLLLRLCKILEDWFPYSTLAKMVAKACKGVRN